MNFGDYEPEDAWDASDSVPDQIANLLRRLALVKALDVRSEHRLAQIRDDLDFIRGRIING